MRDAAVFDCDGLLLDTEKFWKAGERELFAAYGREYTAEHERELLGASGKNAGRILAGALDQSGREADLLSELKEMVWAAVVDGARPMPGAADLVADLGGRLPLGVASNSPRELVREALNVAGLDSAFDVVLGEEDAKRPKPDADLYLAACERLGATPARAVALEDSPTGAAAAKAAGMYVIGVPSEKGVALDANEVVDSLSHPAVRTAILGR